MIIYDWTPNFAKERQKEKTSEKRASPKATKYLRKGIRKKRQNKLKRWNTQKVNMITMNSMFAQALFM